VAGYVDALADLGEEEDVAVVEMRGRSTTRPAGQFGEIRRSVARSSR